MVVKPRRAGSKNPPILSHEFVIQNHADIVACVAMVFVIGLIFQVSAPFAAIFVTLSHNTTANYTSPTPYYEQETLYTAGWKDNCAVFFYTLIAIVLHALIQEYALDKITRKLHLSKVRHSKFNDAGQLLAFSFISTLWGSNIILKEHYLTQIARLWEGFPHQEMNFFLKLFWLFQISYSLHWLPEIYFLRMKKEEAVQKILSSALFLGFVAFAYVTSLTRIGTVLLVLHFVPEIFISFGKLLVYAEKEGASKWVFRTGNFIFILARFLSFVLAALTFYFGLEHSSEAQTLRFTALGLVGGLQSYLLFQFAVFQVKRLRTVAPPTTVGPKSPKKTKKVKSDRDVSDLPEVDQNTRKQAQAKKVKTK